MGPFLTRCLQPLVFPRPRGYARQSDDVWVGGGWVHATWLSSKGETVAPGAKAQQYQKAIPVVCLGPLGPANQPIFLYSHGNAEDLSACYDWCRTLATRFGALVYAYDYTGYGVNRSRPTEKALFGNIETVYRYVCRRHSASRVILFGRSLGTAPSIHAAATLRPRPRGLILESAFKTIFTTVLPFHIPFDMFLNEQTIAHVEVPTLFIHGTKDTVVPSSHGAVLAARCPATWGTLWLKGAGHNDIDSTPCYRDEMFHKIAYFLASTEPREMPQKLPTFYKSGGLRFRRKIK